MQTLDGADTSVEEPDAIADETRADIGPLTMLRWAAIAVVTAVFLIRVLGAPWSKFPQVVPEVEDWRRVARIGPFHPGFWFTSRAPLYPAFMWSLARSTTVIVLAQTLLYVGAVLWLCRTARGALSTRFAYTLAVVFVGAIAIEARTALWTTLLLPQSLSITLAFGLVALWWRVASRLSMRVLTWAWVLTGAWVLLRDTNVVPVVFIIVPVVVIGIGYGSSIDPAIQLRARRGAAVVFLLCAYVVVSQHVGERQSISLDNISNRVQTELPKALRDDTPTFDAFHVRDRLPRHFPAIVGEPRTTGVLWAEVAIGLVALAIASIERKRRRIALFGVAGLAAGIVGLLAALAAAKTDTARQLVPDRALVSVMAVVCVAIGVDALLARRGARAMAAPRPITLDRALSWVTVVLMAGLGFAAVFANWLRAGYPDSQYAREIVVRTAKYGGTYYDNSVLNRGPLEEWFHSLASHISTYDGYWYVISAFIAIVSLIVAITVARTATETAAVRELALAAGIVVFVHLALGSSTYSGVFFVRNITTAVLAIVWLLLLSNRPWQTARSRLIVTAAVGGLLGLAVQSLISEVFVAAVLGVVALVMFGVRAAERRERAKLTRVAVGASIIGFAASPLYYLAIGDFTNYWSGFWTYSSYMNTGTGASLGTQFAMGWQHLYEYYQARPLAFAVIVAFVVLTWIGWPNASTRWRCVHGGLVAWFAASWLEMILSQRYQPQYFVITTVPVALMAAAVAGHAYAGIINARGRFGRPAWYPVVAVALSIWFFGSAGVLRGAHEASSFTSVSAHAKVLHANQTGDDRTFGAALDLVSKRDDPLLAWTLQTWPYLGYRRVAATRFIWESFMAGAIWMGRTGPQYILPHTWQWFDEDVKQSKPVVFTTVDESLPASSPFTTYVNANFTPAIDAPSPMWYRNDVAHAILDPSATDAWHAPQGIDPQSGWTLRDGGATFAGVAGNDPDALPISGTNCFRLDGIVDDPGIAFRFRSATGGPETRLALDGDTATAGDAVSQYSHDNSGTGPTRTKFSLVVGRRAAAVVVGDRVRAVVELPPQASVSLESLRTKLVLSDLRVGDAPAVSC